MKKSIGMLQKRQKDINDRLTELNESTIDENEIARSFNEEEEREYNNLTEEFDKNKSNLKRLQAQNRRATAFINSQGINFEGEQGDRKRMRSRYSITKALASRAFPNDAKYQLAGIELEMHEEAKRETRGFGQQINGIGVPAFLAGNEKRDQNVGTDADGGYTVQTELGGLVPSLNPEAQVMRLGATMMRGLSGNLDLPKSTNNVTAGWKTEVEALTDSDASLGVIQLRPNRLGALMTTSKQLLVQSNVDIDSFMTRKINTSKEIALDTAAINGSGTAPEPRGILNIAGIGSVAIGGNGGAPTRADLIDLQTKLTQNNVPLKNLGYLTTPQMRGRLQQTKTDDGSGLFVWNSPEQLLGFKAFVSTLVPSDLTKGSSNDCHAIIFGNWSELVMGQWGGYDFVVDPYTLSHKNQIRIVANSFWDIQVMHPESFAAIQDARDI